MQSGLLASRAQRIRKGSSTRALRALLNHRVLPLLSASIPRHKGIKGAGCLHPSVTLRGGRGNTQELIKNTSSACRPTGGLLRSRDGLKCAATEADGIS